MEKTFPYSSHTPAPPATAPLDTARRGIDAAGAALHSGIDKVADPARDAVERLSANAHDTVNRLANTAGDTADRLTSQTRHITEGPARAVAYSRSWVQEQPLEAVAAALALGFLFGRLTAR